MNSYNCLPTLRDALHSLECDEIILSVITICYENIKTLLTIKPGWFLPHEIPEVI